MFKVGDIVVPNERSNKKYGHTSKNNGFVGEVSKVEKEHMTVMELESKEPMYMQEFEVEKKYFELRGD